MERHYFIVSILVTFFNKGLKYIFTSKKLKDSLAEIEDFSQRKKRSQKFMPKKVKFIVGNGQHIVHVPFWF